MSKPDRKTISIELTKPHRHAGRDSKPGAVLRLAEDKAEAPIECLQTGPISFARPIPRQDEMFSERISLIFKKLRVVRMVDVKRNTLVYLTYSDRVIEGSPQNSVTAVSVGARVRIPVK